MGSSASKAAKKAYPSTSAGAGSSIARDTIKFTPPPTAFPPPERRSSPSSTAGTARPLASEDKPEEIEGSGGGDPAFLLKLAELGQVRIPDGSTSPFTSRQPNFAQDLLRRRADDPISFPSAGRTDDVPDAQASRNRLDSVSLVALLEARRDSATPEEVHEIAKEFGVDLDVLDSLGRFISPPLIGPDHVIKRKVGDEEQIQHIAIWSDPVVPSSIVRSTPPSTPKQIS